MPDVHLGGESHPMHGHVHGGHGIDGPIHLKPVNVSVAPGDTVETLKEKAMSHKAKRAESPDLAEAEVMLWWATSTNQLTLQSSAGTARSGPVSVQAADAPERKSTHSKNVILEEQLALLAIGAKVLEAWSDSLKKEAQSIRRELHSIGHQDELAARGKAGFEAYLNTLTETQKSDVLHHSHLERLAKMDEGLAQGVGDYLTRIRTSANPHVTDNLPFMLGTLSIGAPMRYDYASGSHVSVGGQTLINPVGGVADHVLPKIMPTYSVELGAIASMMGVGAVYFTMGKTVAEGVSPVEPTYNLKFAKNYAQQMLKTINGSEFNSLAMAMVTASATEGEPLSERRKSELINIVKVVMLSSSLILLYKMQSSFKGKGGGMTEIEFENIVNGDMQLKRNDLAAQLGGDIRDMLDAMPKGESQRLFAALKAYVATNPKTTNLVNVDSVFSGVSKNIETPELLI